MCRDISTSLTSTIMVNLSVLFEKVDKLLVGKMAEFVRAHY